MSEEVYKKKKKTILLSLFCTLGILLIGGISYAFWQKTKVQEQENVIASDCFNVELRRKNDAINLADSYPLSNEAGMQNLPFTFTIENTCNYKVAYTINLEALENSTFQSSSIKVALDDNYKLYSLYSTADKYFDSSKDARVLATGVLDKRETSKEYNLRLWIDENAPSTEQNKTFESKIVINSLLTK